VADYRPTLVILVLIYRINNKAYPLLSYILSLYNLIRLIYNALGKPAIFLRERYVATEYNYYRDYATSGIRFLTYYI